MTCVLQKYCRGSGSVWRWVRHNGSGCRRFIPEAFCRSDYCSQRTSDKSADAVCLLVVVVDLLTEMTQKRADRKTKHTAVKLQKNTANTYKSSISQDNNHQAKLKLTHKKENDSFNQKSTKSYDKLRPLRQKSAMLEKDTAPNWDRKWSLNGQWQITCSSVCITPQGHSLSSLGIRLIYPSLWPTYAMIILIEWRTPDLDLVYQVLFLYT